MWCSYPSKKCFSHGCGVSFSRQPNWKPPRPNLLVNLAVRVVSGRVHQSLVYLLDVRSSPIFFPCGGKEPCLSLFSSNNDRLRDSPSLTLKMGGTFLRSPGCRPSLERSYCHCWDSFIRLKMVDLHSCVFGDSLSLYEGYFAQAANDLNPKYISQLSSVDRPEFCFLSTLFVTFRLHHVEKSV